MLQITSKYHPSMQSNAVESCSRKTSRYLAVTVASGFQGSPDLGPLSLLLPATIKNPWHQQKRTPSFRLLLADAQGRSEIENI